MNDRAGGDLDTLLTAWARQQRLPAQDAREIYHAIVGEPRESLPPTWWSDLASQVTAAIVHASAPTAALGSRRVEVATGIAA